MESPSKDNLISLVNTLLDWYDIPYDDFKEKYPQYSGLELWQIEYDIHDQLRIAAGRKVRLPD